MPGQYIFGCLFPVFILGAGLYAVAFATGNATILWLALLNILAAGGDILIALMAAKYVGKKTYVLDHPTDCGFMAYLS